jgi:hypothetical protein
MNKKLTFGVAIIGLSLVLTACGTTKAPTASSSSPTATGGGPNNRRPDYGQPSTPPEIRGLVKSVVGNEITVLKIDQTQRTASSTASSTNQNAATSGTPTLSLGGSTGGRQGGGGGGFAGGGARQGGGGGFAGAGGAVGGTNSATDRTAMIARLTAMSTGEEKVIIPIGIKMLKADPNSTGKQRTMVEATISDVTADKMLTIWLDPSVTDKKVAEFVLIN